MPRTVAAVAVALISAALVAAQQQDPPQDAVPRFSSQVQLVEVYATVTDAKGGLVTGLRQEDFEIYENGQRQAISTFAAGEFPITVALAVDRSWSMAGTPLRLAKDASQSFLRLLRPEDRSLVVAIDNDADLIAPLAMSRAEQIRAVAALEPWSTTALHDALVASLDRLAPEPGRQALVLFSDGADRYSRATAADVVERARRSHALVYPIGFGRTRPALFAELAVLTGGRSFHLRDVKQLDATLADIARELRYQYLLGYTPAEPIVAGEPEWRAVRVAVTRSGLRVRARDGYLAR